MGCEMSVCWDKVRTAKDAEAAVRKKNLVSTIYLNRELVVVVVSRLAKHEAAGQDSSFHLPQSTFTFKRWKLMMCALQIGTDGRAREGCGAANRTKW